jgi:hypothetical protein
MRPGGDGVPDFSETRENGEVTPRQDPLQVVVGLRSGLPGGAGKVWDGCLASEDLRGHFVSYLD